LLVVGAISSEDFPDIMRFGHSKKGTCLQSVNLVVFIFSSHHRRYQSTWIKCTLQITLNAWFRLQQLTVTVALQAGTTILQMIIINRHDSFNLTRQYFETAQSVARFLCSFVTLSCGLSNSIRFYWKGAG